VVQLVQLENLHNGRAGARVTLPGRVKPQWVALSDLCGDNILHDIYCTLLVGLAQVWEAGASLVDPMDFANQMVVYGLVGCHQIPPQQAPDWLSAVAQEVG
jgi:hypothetical protein